MKASNKIRFNIDSYSYRNCNDAEIELVLIKRFYRDENQIIWISSRSEERNAIEWKHLSCTNVHHSCEHLFVKTVLGECVVIERRISVPSFYLL